MNDSLAAGTQLPWIQRAIEEGYAVIVLNPNLNEHEVTGTPIRVKLSLGSEIFNSRMCN